MTLRGRGLGNEIHDGLVFPQWLTPPIRGDPYGIYDIGRNTGFVNVGTDHDTGAFAVASIRGWWRHEGKHSVESNLLWISAKHSMHFLYYGAIRSSN